jgi:hypothetical protein
MAGYNPNYFNRNLIESMKQTIIKSIVNEGKKPPQDPMPKPTGKTSTPPQDRMGMEFDEAGDFFRKGYAEAKGQKRADVAKETEAQYAERTFTTRKRALENEARHYGKSAQGQKAREEIAKLEKSYQAYKTPKAEPAVPGLKGQPAGAGPDERATAAGQQLPPSAPLPNYTPPKEAMAPVGSSVVSTTTVDRTGTPVTNVGVTPPETPRQRQMADPELQGKINPEKDLSGFFDVTRGIFNRSATPTGKALEPKDIRPAAKPEEQVPAPQQASGASIQSVTPGQIPQNVLDALRRPMGPKAIK